MSALPTVPTAGRIDVRVVVKDGARRRKGDRTLQASTLGPSQEAVITERGAEANTEQEPDVTAGRPRRGNHHTRVSRALRGSPAFVTSRPGTVSSHRGTEVTLVPFPGECRGIYYGGT